MYRMFKKLITSVLLSFFLLLAVFTSSVNAQSTWYTQSYEDWFTKVYDINNPDEIFGERYTAAQSWWVVYGLRTLLLRETLGEERFNLYICQMRNLANGTGPFDPLNSDNCITLFVDILLPFVNNPDSSSAYASAETGTLTKYLPSFPSVSGVGYVREKLSGLRLIPEVKAQGFGFGAASPIRQFWVAVRNLAYFFLVLATIAMAFQVMFRVKLSPQTVITVQSAIPKIIFTLILITFSYAIAGFMIDLMYVAIGLMAGLFQQSGLFNLGDWGRFFNELAGLSYSVFGILFLYILWYLIAAVNLTVTAGVGGIVSGLVAIVFTVIVLIVVIILLFKIAWVLMKSFFMLLILIAGGPIIILGGLVGGGGFTGWLKDIAANLAIYVAIGPLFAFSFLFLASAFDVGIIDAIGNALGNPCIMPFCPNGNILGNSGWSPPFTAGGDLRFFYLFASLAILTIIPKVGDIIKGAISGRPYPIGTALGEAVGGAGMLAYRYGGVQPEAGFRATQAGQWLQNRYGGVGGLRGFVGRGLGRGLTGWGEPQTGTFRARDTGRIQEVRRRGEA